jgi:hypothetical protein
LTVDHELARNYLLSVSYIGNKGTHLFMSRDINYAPVSTFGSIKGCPSTDLNCNENNINQRRLYAFDCRPGQPDGLPCLGQTQEETNSAWSTYHAGVIEVNKSYSQGFSLLASYVYAKYLDVVPFGAEGGLGPRDPTDFRLNYGPSDNNVRQRFTASYIYALPKLKSAHGLLGGVVNDWQNQGVLIAQTGVPYTITSNTDTAATGIGGEYADFVSGQTVNPSHRGVSEYFNPNAFTNAANGTYGNTSRNFLTGPARVNMDFSLFKEFPLFEHGKLQFRSEFFNLFNHPNFGTPDGGVGDGSFGKLTSAADGRILQFALKYIF